MWGRPAPTPAEKPVWSTYELAEYLDQHPQTVIRWCRRWFGDLGKGRNVGRGQGYQIPWQYVYLARAYLRTDHDPTRRMIRDAILASPKDWVVVVDSIVYTCYDLPEAVDKAVKASDYACLIYIGEFKERIDDGTRSERG
jgi:hypothetical protein